MIQAYFLRQLLTPMIGAVTALCGLALLTQSIATLDLIVDQRQTFLLFLEVTVLALPQLAGLLFPFAILIGALFAYNKLSNDSELVAASAAGASRLVLAEPLIKIALIATTLNLAMTLWVQPTSFRHMRETLFQASADLAVTLVRPGQFRSPSEGVTIYVREIDRDGRLVDILVEDARVGGDGTTYIAQWGLLSEVAGETALIMYDGSIQSLDGQGALQYLRFDSTPFILSNITDTPANLFYKLSDRYVAELLFPDANVSYDWRNRDQMIAEGHYRLSSPLYCFTLALIAAAALLGGEFSRIGYVFRIAAGAVAGVVTRLLGFGVQAAAADAPELNFLQYAVPIFGAGAAAAALWWPGRRPRRRPPTSPSRRRAQAQPLAGTAA